MSATCRLGLAGSTAWLRGIGENLCVGRRGAGAAVSDLIAAGGSPLSVVAVSLGEEGRKNPEAAADLVQLDELERGVQS